MRALALLRRVWKAASSCARQFPPGKGQRLLLHTVLGFTSEDIWLLFSLKPSLEQEGLRSSVSGKSSIPRGPTTAEEKWWHTSFSSWDPWGLEKLSDLTEVVHRTWCCGDQQVCLWAAGIRPSEDRGHWDPPRWSTSSSGLPGPHAPEESESVTITGSSKQLILFGFVFTPNHKIDMG